MVAIGVENRQDVPVKGISHLRNDVINPVIENKLGVEMKRPPVLAGKQRDHEGGIGMF